MDGYRATRNKITTIIRFGNYTNKNSKIIIAGYNIYRNDCATVSDGHNPNWVYNIITEKGRDIIVASLLRM